MDQDLVLCPKCGTHIFIGMFPFCSGDPSDHGAVSPKTAGFPFTVNHVDGKPMVIESMQHLRKVESKYGVVFSAFSKANERDLDPIKDLPRYKGDDPGMKRR